MTSGLHIRPMIMDDWVEFHEMDANIFPDDSMGEDWFGKRVQNGGCFVLSLDERIVGNLIVGPYGDNEGYLGRIGVAKAHQCKGYGSMLMEYAIKWFSKQGGIDSVHLYTQDFNKVAQELYRKFGFQKSATSWHFFVPYNTLQPTRECTCQGIQEKEIEPVGKQFPSLPAAQIRRFLTDDEYRILTLKNKSGSIVGACRFTPSFPGCMPFEITNVSYFDDFVAGLAKFGLPEYDYARITFTNIPRLARLCEERGYRLHHRLHKMTLTL